MSDVFALEFETPAGETLRLRVGRRVARGSSTQSSAAPTPWQLDGELDWDEIELIRVLSARFDDGRLLGDRRAAPGRRRGPRRGVRRRRRSSTARATSSSSTRRCSRSSTSADGLPRRVGLELYRGEGAIPLRVAGDVTGDRARRTAARSSRTVRGARASPRRRRRPRAPRPRLRPREPAPSIGHLRLRRRPDDAADRLVRGRPGPDRDRAGSRSAARCRRSPSATARTRSTSSRWAGSPRSTSSPGSADALEPELGHRPELHRFSEIYFEALHPNEPMIELMREIKRQRPADGDADQQRARVGAAVARRCCRSTRSSSSSSTPPSSACASPTRRSTSSRSSGSATASAPSRLPVHRRHRGQHRRGARELGMSAVHFRRQRAGDRRDPRGARARLGRAVAALR